MVSDRRTLASCSSREDVRSRSLQGRTSSRSKRRVSISSLQLWEARKASNLLEVSPSSSSHVYISRREETGGRAHPLTAAWRLPPPLPSFCSRTVYKTPKEAHAAVPVFDYVICKSKPREVCSWNSSMERRSSKTGPGCRAELRRLPFRPTFFPTPRLLQGSSFRPPSTRNHHRLCCDSWKDNDHARSKR